MACLTHEPCASERSHHAINSAQPCGRNNIATAVAEFHRTFGLPYRTTPSVDVDPALQKLRVSLLEEEVAEFIAAVRARDLVSIADALADITCVVYGTALTYGIDHDLVLAEVH